MRVVLFVLLLVGVGNASALDTLRQIRARAMWLANVDTTGTARIDTGMVRAFVNINEQQVATDFLWADPPAYVHDTFVVIGGSDPSNRGFQYDLPSDFVDGGLLDALKRPRNESILTPLVTTAPDQSSSLEDPPSHAWARGSELWVWPMPKNADTIFISYRAIPPSMDSTKGVTLVNEQYRKWIVYLTVADIKLRQGYQGYWVSVQESYRVAKQKRTATTMQAQQVIE